MRRGVSIAELMLSISLTMVLLVIIAHSGGFTARHHQELTKSADDLRQVGAALDRLTREVRESTGVASRSPDARLKTSREALVVHTRDGGWLAVSLQRLRQLPARLVLSRWDSSERFLGREDLGQVGELRLSYDARWPAEVQLVSFDLGLPLRGSSESAPTLSSAALVGAGERIEAGQQPGDGR